MVIFIVVLLLILGTALVGALYSSFLIFYLSFWDTIEYNKAYYAAISSLERAELVLRYRSPGYEGNGGWLGTSSYGNAIDHKPAFSLWEAENGSFWNIRSRTTSIPKVWEGNVEWMLMTWDSANYNMLDYVNAENITLSLDPSSGYPYSTVSLSKSNVASIEWKIRLPSMLYSYYKFWNLNTDSHDIGDDRIFDDVVVDWSFRGTYNSNSFQIFGTPSVKYYGTPSVDYSKDTLFRESKINSGSPIKFAGSKSPFSTSTPPQLTIISIDENTLKSKNFDAVLKDSKTTGVIFRVALLNLLYAKSGNIYPYLEYQFSFKDSAGTLTSVADRFYTITATGKYGNYEVKLLVKKPTIKESVLGSFTIIF